MRETDWFEGYGVEPAQRLTVLPWLLWALLLAAMVAGMAYCSMASADEPNVTFVAEVGENKLFIFPEPCTLGGWFEKWRKARWVFDGQSFEACWKLQRDHEGNIQVHTVDAAGDAGSVPVGYFKKAVPI